MTSAITTATSVAPLGPDATRTSSAASSSNSSLGNASNASASSTTDTNVISPRLAYNSTVGLVVTEFLSGSGQVEEQLPSQVAVAYLEAGLTAQGSPKPHEAPGSDSFLNSASA